MTGVNSFFFIELFFVFVIIEEGHYKEFISALRLNLDEQTFVIDQGGADEGAIEGLAVLADEIRDAKLDIQAVCTPSGTGTTALYLAHSLPEYIVYTTPCVGSVQYLKEQMNALSDMPKNLIILEPLKKVSFCKTLFRFFRYLQKALGMWN